VDECDHGGREHLTDEQLEIHIRETNLILIDQLKSKWQFFKDSNVCHAEYMTYMINIICYLCDIFISNMKEAMPFASETYHKTNLIKAICDSLELQINDHRLKNTGTKH